MIKFQTDYYKLPESFYQEALPETFPNPELIIFNKELAEELNLDSDLSKDQRELTQIFSGQKIVDNSKPLSQAYAGHQYAHFVPLLGDGRAILLGEVLNKENKLFDLQLKGAGTTPYSRPGTDGRSALGPAIREYLVSEGMNNLGIPTTRSLAVVKTGEFVERQEGSVDGGILTRVANSHLRIGTFEYFSAREDLGNLKILLDYAIKRHYPEILPLQANLDYSEKALLFLEQIVKKQAFLVASWLSVGFVHGVMNTDNIAISGQTIDYGPCAFLERFNFQQSFSSIDRYGRYAYINQGPIAAWNLGKLAECLIPLVDPTNDQEAIKKLNQVLANFQSEFNLEFLERFSKKLGGIKVADKKIIHQWLSYLEQAEKDFTLSFRKLSKVLAGEESFFLDSKLELFLDFKKAWLAELEKAGQDKESIVKEMEAQNPIYIPRNHLVERAIQKAYQGDFSFLEELNQVLKKPFQEQEGSELYQKPANAQEEVLLTYCGT